MSTAIRRAAHGVRPAVLGALLVTLSLAVSSCASLPMSMTAQVPTTGPIQQGAQVDVDPEDQFIRVIARKPRPGMSPGEVVSGFLDASASFEDDHAVARSYLTPAASAAWNTNAGVTVYTGLPAVAVQGSAVSFTAPHAGTISRQGAYTVADPGAEVRTTFFLEEVDGEWRISTLPEGLVLSEADVDRAFRSFNVYFFNPEYSRLVPDPRMIPVVGPGLATALVRRLLAGPNEWLQPAVRTGFPSGVGLNIDAVPIEAGVAKVDLTVNALDVDDVARVALSKQLIWTLKQLPDIVSVDVTAAGQPLVVPGVASPQPRDAWIFADPNAMPLNTRGYATRPEGVVSVGSGATLDLRPVPGGAGTGEVVLIDIAVADDSGSLAGIDPEGAVWRARLAEGATMIKVRDERQAVSVAFDPSGSVWVVEDDQGLVSVSPAAVSREILVDGLVGRPELRAAVPSRDGTRAALVVRRGPRTELLVARIVSSSTSPSGLVLQAPMRVESRLAEVLDVAWSGADTLAVVGSESAGSLQVFEVDLARGTVTPRGAPEAPVSIAAAPGLPTLAGGADGMVYELGSGRWTERLRGSAPTYP